MLPAWVYIKNWARDTNINKNNTQVSTLNQIHAAVFEDILFFIQTASNLLSFAEIVKSHYEWPLFFGLNQIWHLGWNLEEIHRRSYLARVGQIWPLSFVFSKLTKELRKRKNASYWRLPSALPTAREHAKSVPWLEMHDAILQNGLLILYLEHTMTLFGECQINCSN